MNLQRPVAIFHTPQSEQLKWGKSDGVKSGHLVDSIDTTVV